MSKVFNMKKHRCIIRMSGLTALGIWLTLITTVVLAVYIMTCMNYWDTGFSTTAMAVLAAPVMLFIAATLLMHSFAETRQKYIAARRKEAEERLHAIGGGLQ